MRRRRIIAVAIVTVGMLISAVSCAPPPGFRPASVDAASTGRDHALGAAPCRAGFCAWVLRTTDGGAHWAAQSTPPLPSDRFTWANPWRIRFADDRTGYLFGDGGLPLYATHDAGSHWNAPPGVCGGSTCAITSLAVAGRTVYAYQETRGGGMLLTSPLDRDHFTYVPAVSGPYTGEIAASGPGVYVLTDNQRLWAHTATGWQPRSLPTCPHGTLDALTARDVILVCDLTGGTGAVTRKAYVSHDSAMSWVALPDPPQTGQTKAVFANVGSLFGYAVVVTTTAGTSVQVTRDAGAHWTTPLTSPSTQFADAGFATARRGYLVVGDPTANSVAYRTTDAGQHWAVATFHG